MAIDRRSIWQRLADDTRMQEITIKAGTVGGITPEERDEWHSLLSQAASQYGTVDSWAEVIAGVRPVYLDATAYPHANPGPDK